jgi:hypothetical protein
MPSLRHETYYAGEQLIHQMHHSGTLQRMLHDGGDIFLFETASGAKVSIHMIESGIPLYEIRKILNGNTRQGIYTLFMLWCSMMVPNDGQIFKMTDWMQAFIALNGDRIYAYDIFDSEVYLFQVYFHRQGNSAHYLVEYGLTVRAGRLGYKDLDLRLSPDDLTWKVAYFGVPKYSAHDVLTGAVVLSGLEAAYALLGVDAGDDRDTVKQAYRLLARRYHPDQNQDPAAHEHMQRLNDAYQRVLAALDVGQ